MPTLPDPADLAALREFDSPTICNALELVVPARRAMGFTRRPLIAAFPNLKPVVAFARTAIIRSREPHPRSREEATRVRLAYYEQIAAQPLPSIAVIQDIDGPDQGFGAFWGEVQAMCQAWLRRGRDPRLGARSRCNGIGSLSLPARSCPRACPPGRFRGHGIAGMIVSPNDVIHADRHGVVIRPRRSRVTGRRGPVRAARGHHRRCQAPGFSVARLPGRASRTDPLAASAFSAPQQTG